MCVHCKGIHGRFQSASLRNFFPSGLSIGLKLTAGTFLEDMISRNKFPFQVFATDYMVFVGQLASRRWLQVGLLLYHCDINIKRFSNVRHRTDSDVRLFTHSLVNYCFPWLRLVTFPIDTLRKSRNYRIMNVDLGSTNAVDKASATLGRVMTLRISARVSGFIRTRTQFVGRFCEISETSVIA